MHYPLFPVTEITVQPNMANYMVCFQVREHVKVYNLLFEKPLYRIIFLP